MQSVNLLSWAKPNRLLSIISTTSAGIIGLGTYIGILAVTMWQQWSLTFGYDPQLLLIVALVLALRFWLGQRWYLSKATLSGKQSIAPLIYCLSAWAVLFPFWIDTLATFAKNLPIGYLENELSKTLLFFTLAVLGWAIPGMLWSALFLHEGILANECHSSKRQTFALLLSGISLGLVLNSIVLSPWFGYFLPGAGTAILGSVVAGYITRRTANDQRWTSVTTTILWEGDRIETIVRFGMACSLGGLLACNLRLANQLMPHASFVIFAQFAGILSGVAAGLTLAGLGRNVTSRPAWSGLVAVACSMALLASQPLLVNLSLWMNASFSFVAILLAARFLLLAAIAFPFGLALAWIVDDRQDDVDSRLITWATPFSMGLAVGMYVLGGTISIVALMAACSLLMVAAIVALQTRTSPKTKTWRLMIAVSCVVLVLGSMPVWSARDDASRTAKLLYSAPTFIAYRSGWSIDQLPLLDDTRMIERREGRTGPLTLWRGRVDELYIRESGIPRAAITKNSDAVPQYPVEVLQAVYPLVLSERPGRVLFLGLPSSVNLTTSLGFPIREAVCVESDQNLIDLVRGPIKRETGFDPFDDDRVTLKRVSPELAVMVKPEQPYDVILCSSAASSLAEGSPFFTSEFYQRAAGQLAEQGIFCQRYEGIDFGPGPLRMVLKSFRGAFRNTMAVETTTGELLLLASNAADALVPNNLESRLEMPHVRRVLARSGLDWSALLNFPAYDHEALGEICDESRGFANSILHGQLAAGAAPELMRWGNKPQEVQAVLTANRTTAPFYQSKSESEPNRLEGESFGSRRSRLVEWMGEDASAGLIRRLGEIASQQKVVREHPDAHWWAYRRTLRKQLLDRPRSAIQQVKAVDQKRKRHPEDVHRLDYFSTLGTLVNQEKPSREQIASLEQFLEPFDPLLSYFGRHEAADLLARADADPRQELVYRLHVIYFAPTIDASVRNVARAIETVVNHPETVSDDAARFDALNGLIQTLRVRWEIRQTVTENSSGKILDDIDQSLIAVEKGVAMLDSLAAQAQVSERDWQIRRNVIDRLMLRPLRTYRTTLQTKQRHGQATGEAILEEASRDDDLDGIETE